MFRFHFWWLIQAFPQYKWLTRPFSSFPSHTNMTLPVTDMFLDLRVPTSTTAHFYYVVGGFFLIKTQPETAKEIKGNGRQTCNTLYRIYHLQIELVLYGSSWTRHHGPSWTARWWILCRMKTLIRAGQENSISHDCKCPRGV